MATIDVGTVAGISIGTTPPSNPAIIWYDTTDKLHKSYDASLGQWVPMSQAIVTQINDFNDLINKANLPGGLPIAAFYNVLKRDSDPFWSTMVWVVGQTRIQYVDKQNNIIVEDSRVRVRPRNTLLRRTISSIISWRLSTRRRHNSISIFNSWLITRRWPTCCTVCGLLMITPRWLSVP